MALDGKQVGAFHKNHGTNIHLLDEGRVAHRKDSYNKAVVFTEYPINIGGLFEVKIEDIGGGWAGSLVSVNMLEYCICLMSEWVSIHSIQMVVLNIL